MGTGSPRLPAWNSQRPLRFSQLLRTICGRGYSGSGQPGSTSSAQGVMSGACGSSQAPANLGRKASPRKPSTKPRAPGRRGRSTTCLAVAQRAAELSASAGGRSIASECRAHTAVKFNASIRNSYSQGTRRAGSQLTAAGSPAKPRCQAPCSIAGGWRSPPDRRRRQGRSPPGHIRPSGPPAIRRHTG